jgi:iron(III) transport system ATP-binding protein
MATKSILKNININKRKDANQLISALEQADNKSSKTVTISRTLSEATREDIRRVFGAGQ